MIRHTLLLEILISVLYIKEIVVDQDHSLFAMIMALLIYLCLKVIYYIFINKNVNKYISFLLVITIIGLGGSVFQPMTYFLSINLAQFIGSIKKGKYFFIRYVLIVCIIDSEDLFTKFYLIKCIFSAFYMG